MHHQSVASIRAARPADAPAIERLYRQLVSNPSVTVQPDRLARLANDHNTQILIAEVANEVQGTALLIFCEDVMFNAQPFGLVENIVVAEGSRCKGIGSALLRRIEELGFARQCSKLMLLSASARDSAHKFFGDLGYNGSAKRGFVKYARSFSYGTAA